MSQYYPEQGADESGLLPGGRPALLPMGTPQLAQKKALSSLGCPHRGQIRVPAGLITSIGLDFVYQCKGSANAQLSAILAKPRIKKRGN